MRGEDGLKGEIRVRGRMEWGEYGVRGEDV